ncbi:MAG: DNA-3-methyladenine glycosylase II, partial [Natronomonas sp.]
MDSQVLDHLRTDPALEPYIREFGSLELDPAEDTFERLIVSLIRQQVSMDAAAA